MTTKHTPGPWRVKGEEDTECGLSYVIKSQCEVKAFKGLYDCNLAQVWGGKENANLIAAAPELLEALKWIIEDFDDPFDQPESIHNAKLLISAFNL